MLVIVTMTIALTLLLVPVDSVMMHPQGKPTARARPPCTAVSLSAWTNQVWNSPIQTRSGPYVRNSDSIKYIHTTNIRIRYVESV